MDNVFGYPFDLTVGGKTRTDVKFRTQPIQFRYEAPGIAIPITVTFRGEYFYLGNTEVGAGCNIGGSNVIFDNESGRLGFFTDTPRSKSIIGVTQ